MLTSATSKLRICTLVSLFWLFLLPVVQADEPATEEETVSESEESTPRKTMRGLLAVMSGSGTTGLEAYFDTRRNRQLRDIDVNAVIEAFPDMLDQYGSLVPMGLLSQEPQGQENDGLAENLEQVGAIKKNDIEVAIVLERVTLDAGEPQWLISRQTLVSLAPLVQSVDVAIINQYLPTALVELSWRGAPVGQWIGVLVIGLLCVGTGWALSTSFTYLSKRYSANNEESGKSQVFRALAIPAGLVFATILFVYIERHLEVSILIRQDLSIVTITLLWVALFIFLWSLIDRLSARGEQILREKNRLGGLSIVIFFRGSAKIMLFLLALILVLHSNGVDVTTGLAALGIGGIALALGAQKAIENLVGSITIVADQPIRVGDFCRIGDMLGTVERVGLRSTRIRTLSDTVVTFPNGMLSSEKIENFTMRRKFHLRTVLNLRYETKPQDLERLLSAIREVLSTRHYVSKEIQRVRFVGYGPSSLDVEVRCYIFAGDYDSFLEKQESILLAIYPLVEENGSGFAFPSQTLYFARDNAPHKAEQSDSEPPGSE